MFVGKTAVCLVEVVFCGMTSGYIEGVYKKEPICIEYIKQKVARCKILKIDKDKDFGDNVRVDCKKDLERKYNVANNFLNKKPMWVKMELCSAENDHN